MRNNPREVLLTLHRRHVKAWEQKNLEGLRNLYAEDAVIFNTAPPPRFSDFKSFENTLHQYFTQIQDMALFTSNIQIEVRGEVAWITSQYLMACQLKDRLIRQNGRWTEIYHQVNDHWKLTHLHSSPDPLDGRPERKPYSGKREVVKRLNGKREVSRKSRSLRRRRTKRKSRR